MITVTKQYSFTFTSDGTSTVLTVDMSQPPNSVNFAGRLPSAVVTPSYSNGQGVTQPTLSTVTLSGTTLTWTFATPPPQFDINSVLVEYTATFTLEF